MSFISETVLQRAAGPGDWLRGIFLEIHMSVGCKIAQFQSFKLWIGRIWYREDWIYREASTQCCKWGQWLQTHDTCGIVVVFTTTYTLWIMNCWTLRTIQVGRSTSGSYDERHQTMKLEVSLIGTVAVIMLHLVDPKYSSCCAAPFFAVSVWLQNFH